VIFCLFYKIEFNLYKNKSMNKTITNLPLEVVDRICNQIADDSSVFSLLVGTKQTNLLTSIKLNNVYDQAKVIDKPWYNQITRLKNVSNLYRLPPNIEYIKLSGSFRKIIPYRFSRKSTLKHLDLNDYRRKLRPGVLPINLEILEIKILDILGCVNQLADIVLPKSLIKLNMAAAFDRSCDISYIPYHRRINHNLPKFPPNLKILHLGIFDTRILTPGDLPDSLEELHLGKYNDNSIISGVLPKNLKILHMGNNYNSYLPPLPESLRELYLGDMYNITLGVLPKKLEILDLGRDYNHAIAPDILPSTLRVLILSHYFTQPIDLRILPESLEYIDFGILFDHPLCGVFPSKIKQIKLSGMFDQPLGRIFPESLEILDLGVAFTQDIDDGILPQSLHTLIISDFFNGRISEKSFPANLNTLIWKSEYQSAIKPTNLKEFKIDCTKELEYNQVLLRIPRILLGKQPLDRYRYGPLPQLPTHLNSLTFGSTMNQPIDFQLPTHLNSLTFGSTMHQPILVPFGSSLQQLIWSIPLEE